MKTPLSAIARGAGDYFLGALLMSLAWSLRGQFGHLKGALIPGALAAATAIVIARDEHWRKAFGAAVIMAALGFSLGGHFGYGKLIETLMTTRDMTTLIRGFLHLGALGAVWGGVGMTFLGFGLSEKPVNRSDLAFLAFLGLFWFIPLGIFNRESYDLFLFGAGFLLMHFYNFRFKKSKMMTLFGVAGLAGFGLAFCVAVLLLRLGAGGMFGEEARWWSLRDQMLGAIGGIAVVFATLSSRRQALFPSPEFMTAAVEKAGFVFALVFIPLINSIGVFHDWFFKERFIESATARILLISMAALFFTVLSCILLKADARFFTGKARDRTLLAGLLFFIWFFIFLAVAKSVLPHGMNRWETAFTLFFVFGSLLSVLLPLKILRGF